MTASEEDKILDLLRSVQLDQFYRQILDRLHVSRLNHFDHVTEDDLDGLGMSKPAQRRLFEALKKAKKKTLFGSFRRKKSKTKLLPDSPEPPSVTTPSAATLPASSSLTCLISEKSVVLQEMIGDGAFGYVRRGEWTTDSKIKVDVAVKCLKFSRDAAFVQMQTDFIKEANAMSLLDHAHIIKLYGVVLAAPLMLVTELAPLGCLLTALRNNRQRFMISMLCDFVVQVASGMAYLESQRFIHRDLAARNLLLESYDKVKIGDFGLMRVLSEEDDYYTMNPKGKVPFAWCPPEALKYRKFSYASDVWSFGICVIELFSYGEEPWPGLNGGQILAKVDMPRCERPHKPSHCPSQIYRLLVSRCWAHDPANRSGFAVLKQAIEQVRPRDVRAIHNYDSKSPQNLCFEEGDKITLIEASAEASWWRGQNKRSGRVGMFPSELVEGGPRAGSRNTSPTPAFKRIVQPPSSLTTNKTLCACAECGEKHIYEIPVLLPAASPAPKSSGSCSRNSFRSLDSEISFPSECDSGYSSSIDGRRFYQNNSDHSTDSSKNDLTSSYENCNPGYETMDANVPAPSRPIAIPDEGVNHFGKESKSDPVSIPQRGGGIISVRQRISDPPNWNKIKGRMSDPLCGSPKLERTMRGHSGSSPKQSRSAGCTPCMSSSPREDVTGASSQNRCPLDFTTASVGTKTNSHLNGSNDSTPPPLPPRTPSPSSSKTSLSPRSGPIAASSPELRPRGSIGESFAKEMISFISNCSSENFQSAEPNAEIKNSGKPLVNQNEVVGVPWRSNSLGSVTLRNRPKGERYENHDVIPRRASMGSRRLGNQDHVTSGKFDIQLQNDDNRKLLKSEIAKAVEDFERHVYRKSSLENQDAKADLKKLNSENCENVKNEKYLQKRTRSNTSPISYENCWPTSPPGAYENMNLENSQTGEDEVSTENDGEQRLRQGYENCKMDTQRFKSCENTKPSTQVDIYCDMRLSAPTSPRWQRPLPSYENHDLPITEGKIELEKGLDRPAEKPDTKVLSKSLPSAFNLKLIERKIDLDGAISLVIEQQEKGTVRRCSSTGDILDILKHDAEFVCCESDDGGGHPVAPPRLKKRAKQARAAANDKTLSVSVTGKLASALRQRRNKSKSWNCNRTLPKERKPKRIVVKGEISSSHSIKIATPKKQEELPRRVTNEDKARAAAEVQGGKHPSGNSSVSPGRRTETAIIKQLPKAPLNSQLTEEPIAPPLPGRQLAFTPSKGKPPQDVTQTGGQQYSYENVTGTKVPPLPRKGSISSSPETKPKHSAENRQETCSKMSGEDDDEEDANSEVLCFENKLIGFHGLPSVAPLELSKPAPELPPKLKSPTSPLHRSSSWSSSRLSALGHSSFTKEGSTKADPGPDKMRYRPCPTKGDLTYEVPRRDIMTSRGKEDFDVPPPLPRKLSRQNTSPDLLPRPAR